MPYKSGAYDTDEIIRGIRGTVCRAVPRDVWDLAMSSLTMQAGRLRYYGYISETREVSRRLVVALEREDAEQRRRLINALFEAVIEAGFPK